MPIQPYSEWSRHPERTTYLREHYGQDSAAAIAKALGISRNAVIGRARRLGLACVPAAVHAFQSEAAKNRPRVERGPLPWRHPARRPQHHQPQDAVNEMREIISSPVSIYDAGEHHCRAIVGQVSEGIALFCGAPKQDGYSYCPGHVERYFMPPRPRYCASSVQVASPVKVEAGPVPLNERQPAKAAGSEPVPLRVILAAGGL